MRKLAHIALLVLAVAAIPSPAGAFNREKAEGSGKELYWPAMPVSFAINSICAGADVSSGDCISTVGTSFLKWMEPDCTFLTFDNQGITSRTDVGYNDDSPANNINLVIWYFEGWPYEKSGIALTTATYKTETGEIVDADMELNGQDYRFAILETPDPLYTDIANVVVHEAGHFIGLDHSADPVTTMYPYAPYGEVNKRVLSQDDIDGVCAIYPGEKADGGNIKTERDCSCTSVDVSADETDDTILLAAAVFLAAAALIYRLKKG